MEIDITAFVKQAEPCQFSASQMELGKDAGKITWNNAKQEAANSPLLNSDVELDACRAWAKEFGAWEPEEIAAWSAEDCNALLIQYISGELRELESLCWSDDDENGIDWEKARKLSERGTIAGTIYPGDDGRIYFYMGH
jgi:hypothetical protein